VILQAIKESRNAASKIRDFTWFLSAEFGGDQSTTICPRSCLMGPAEAEALGPVVAVPLCQALAAASASSTRAWILFALVRLAQFSSCHQQLLDAGLVD